MGTSCLQNYKAVSRPRRYCYPPETVTIKWWRMCSGVKKQEIESAGFGHGFIISETGRFLEVSRLPWGKYLLLI